MIKKRGKEQPAEEMNWMVYILRCKDNTLYTGATDDIERRFKAHNSGKGAKYTRGRSPVELIYCESCADKPAALRREAAIKRMSRARKLALAGPGGGMKESFEIAPQAKLALNMLNAAGYEAWLVGGCVRDLVMGFAPKDWDMTTSARPDEIMHVFKDFKIIETGLKHGTVTVIVDSMPLEITAYRVDGEYSDKRHPDNVRFTKRLSEDLGRRDFTMNALAYCPEKGLVDCFGGTGDIRAGLIRCVGEPARRFEEDALRILRALRFAATLGFELEENTSRAVMDERSLLDGVAAERVREEMTKLLCGKNASAVLRRYAEVFAAIIPEIAPMFGFEQHNVHHCLSIWEHSVTALENTPPEPALRWAALLHDIGKPDCFSLDEHGSGHFYGHEKRSVEISRQIMSRLHFDNALRDRVLTLIGAHGAPIPAERRIVKRRLNRLGVETFFELLLLFRADNMAQAECERGRQRDYDELERMARDIIAEDDCFSLKKLAVNGHDVMAMGYRGRKVGEILNMLLESVMDGKVSNDREALVKYLFRSEDHDK